VPPTRSTQSVRVRPALEGLDALAFDYGALRELLKEQKGWMRFRSFAASTRHCRTVEAEALNEVARKALVCVEEVAVNAVAAELAAIEYRPARDGHRLMAFLR